MQEKLEIAFNSAAYFMERIPEAMAMKSGLMMEPTVSAAGEVSIKVSAESEAVLQYAAKQFGEVFYSLTPVGDFEPVYLEYKVRQPQPRVY